MMLNGKLELHRNGCNQRDCRPDDCILDAEDFARSVLNDHIAFGARRTDGTFTGAAPLSAEDFTDCLTDLVAASWQASTRFDGRGRLAGYVAWKLHKEITDWKRRRWRSTRYLDKPITETPYDDELNGAIHHDDELIGIDPARLTCRAQHAYRKVCKPMVEQGLEPAEFAARSSQSVFWVMQALRIVRAEFESQGIRPSTMIEREPQPVEEAVA